MNSPLKKKSLSSEEVERARKLLGLGECATLAEIKNAFREMAKRYHPDKCREDKLKCEEMMRKLNEAHEIILTFLSGYRYCFNQKPTEEEEYWEDFKERFYKDFII
jgi:hypothetical protein